jgi:hypothetical protein
MTDDIVTRLQCIYDEDGCAQCTFCLAKAKIEYLRVENDEQNEDIVRLLTEVGRLRAAGDGLVAVISNCECVTNEQCGWCIAKDKWEEAKNG